MSFINKKTFKKDEADKVWFNQFGNVEVAFDITRTKVIRSHHSEYGWHVDHKKPISKGGANKKLCNLQVLTAKENRKKNDQYPRWIDSKGNSHTQKGC